MKNICQIELLPSHCLTVGTVQSRALYWPTREFKPISRWVSVINHYWLLVSCACIRPYIWDDGPMNVFSSWCLKPSNMAQGNFRPALRYNSCFLFSFFCMLFRTRKHSAPPGFWCHGCTAETHYVSVPPACASTGGYPAHCCRHPGSTSRPSVQSAAFVGTCDILCGVPSRASTARPANHG